MPTELGRKYALDWRGNPPHMLQPDVPVWYNFLEKWGSQFLSLYYDCLLGGKALTPEEQEFNDWMDDVDLEEDPSPPVDVVEKS